MTMDTRVDQLSQKVKKTRANYHLNTNEEVKLETMGENSLNNLIAQSACFLTLNISVFTFITSDSFPCNKFWLILTLCFGSLYGCVGLILINYLKLRRLNVWVSRLKLYKESVDKEVIAIREEHTGLVNETRLPAGQVENSAQADVRIAVDSMTAHVRSLENLIDEEFLLPQYVMIYRNKLIAVVLLSLLYALALPSIIYSHSCEKSKVLGGCGAAGGG